MNIRTKLLMTAVAFSIIAVDAAAAVEPATNPLPTQFWWPDVLDLKPLRRHAAESNPLGGSFDYAAAFNTLDLAAVKKDIAAVLTTSQGWWPADYGTYAPFFIRLAWHSAGTYRMMDGRGGAGGGQQRFEPLNSWPDNANLDKARRLLWPIKQKYGQKISWADLMVLTGNVSLESMGFKTFGFGGGRIDDWEPEAVDWGSADHKFMSTTRDAAGKLAKPISATQMGLIYVNPEGPNGNPDPISAAHDIRETFGRMAMNDEETVALIAGGHTFGKAHGARAGTCKGVEPAGGGVEAQGIGWQNKCGKGNGADTVTSGLEGAWSDDPIVFTTHYLDNLLRIDWVQTKSPAGAIQWQPSDASKAPLTPDAHIAGVQHPLMMFTTDLSLKFDPSYRKISERFQQHPDEFALAFSKAWFKLTHRDMGPVARYLGPDVPKQVLLWQDPLPAATYTSIDAADIVHLKAKVLASGVTTPQLVRTAWASAASFRGTDKRGGANGARVRLAPEKDWAANDPAELAKVLGRLDTVRTAFNRQATGGKQVSLADLIVLSGGAAIEQAAKKAGYAVEVPFTPGRTDASAAETDIKAFDVLEATADGFRNYYAKDNSRSPAELLVNRADMLTLTVPEMTVLVGGMRSLNANDAGSPDGVFTSRPGTLSNDFFVNLLDMSTTWKKSPTAGVYEGVDRASGKHRWTATPVDLVFGSNSELRAVSEVYAANDAKAKFVTDFVAAWTKVMNLDRFDLRPTANTPVRVASAR